MSHNKKRVLTDIMRHRRYEQKRAYKKRKRASATLMLLQARLKPGEEDALIVYVDFNDAKVSGRGYLGPRSKGRKHYSLKKAMRIGLRKHEWDGR